MIAALRDAYLLTLLTLTAAYLAGLLAHTAARLTHLWRTSGRTTYRSAPTVPATPRGWTRLGATWTGPGGRCGMRCSWGRVARLGGHQTVACRWYLLPICVPQRLG